MTSKQTDKNKLLKSISGMGMLTNGTLGNSALFAAFDENMLIKLLRDQNNMIDQDVGGTKTALYDTIRGARGGVLINKDKIQGLEGILHSNGYLATFDGLIDADEDKGLLDLETKLKSGLSLTSIANANFKATADAEAALEAKTKLDAENAAKAEAETLRAEQAQSALSAEVAAGLNYAGLMDGSTSLRKALGTLVANTTDISERQDRLNAMFDENGQLTAEAATFVHDNTKDAARLDANGNDRLKEDLESNDPVRISRAQSYLNLRGDDLDVNGKTDQATFDAGQAAIRAPLTIPAGLINADGSVSIEDMHNMSVAGQLYLPIDKLSAEDRAVAEAMPLAKDRTPADIFSREQFIAARLIGDDPTKYQAILDEENVRRAKLTLDVTVVQPEVAIEAGTPVIEERKEANNPLGIDAAGEALADAPLMGSEINNAAVGKTDQSGELVFSDTEKGLVTFVDYMKASTPDGKITMLDAMRGLHYADISAQEAFLGAATGSGGIAVPPPQHAERLTDMLGVDPDHKFDLNNPADVQKVLTGLVGYTNRQSYGQDFIKELEKDTPWMDSIKKASGADAAPVDKPEQAPKKDGPKNEEQLISLNGDFTDAASGKVKAVPVKPAPATPSVTDNTYRYEANIM